MCGKVNKGLLSLITLIGLVPLMSGFGDSDSGSSGSIWFTVFVILAVMIIIFLVCREITCWYFKINERISQQASIIKLLEDINQGNKSDSKSNTDIKSENNMRCAGCKQVDIVDNLIFYDETGLYYHADCIPEHNVQRTSDKPTSVSFCSHCGTKTSGEDNFCQVCGKSLL
jgi:hypothetical protein